MDHVLGDAGRAEPYRSGDRIMVLRAAIAAAADPQPAFEHHDDFGIARQDIAEITLRVAPALGEDALPA